MDNIPQKIYLHRFKSTDAFFNGWSNKRESDTDIEYVLSQPVQDIKSAEDVYRKHWARWVNRTFKNDKEVMPEDLSDEDEHYWIYEAMLEFAVQFSQPLSTPVVQPTDEQVEAIAEKAIPAFVVEVKEGEEEVDTRMRQINADLVRSYMIGGYMRCLKAMWQPIPDDKTIQAMADEYARNEETPVSWEHRQGFVAGVKAGINPKTKKQW